MSTPQIYNKGTASDPSTIDGAGQEQLNPFFYDKAAIVESNKVSYLGQLSGVRNQPKNAGKEIKKHLIIPVLDDRNINDQGIDAAGVVLDSTKWTAINGAGAIVGTAYASEATAITAAGASGTTKQTSGNLFGSSRDVATVTALTPVLSETAREENRIGFSREIVKSTLENYGFYYEFTKDDLNFDSDAKLKTHLYREAGKAAGEMVEKSLMADLMNGAGIELFTGGKTTLDAVAAADLVTLADIRKMSKVLNANKAPMDTKVISGSRNIDTKVVAGARYAYTSDDMITILEDVMNATTSKHAWKYVEEYQAGSTYAKSNVAKGEAGAIGKVRFIEHPEMLIQENKGAAAIDVHPILFVGSGSFTQVGFQSSGNTTKFEIITKMPGKDSAMLGNVYGKIGFVSNNYWYGMLIERPDHIGVIYGAVA